MLYQKYKCLLTQSFQVYTVAILNIKRLLGNMTLPQVNNNSAETGLLNCGHALITYWNKIIIGHG